MTSPAEKVGVRPYEMEGRKENRKPLVDFEDLTGWTVQLENGADAQILSSREQQLWGEHVGKLTYTGKSQDSKVTIRPTAPIPISEQFDCINAWIYGNLWEWAPEPGTPFLDVSILFKDADGNERSVYLTKIRWKEWWLAHKKLDAAMEGASFAGIEIKGISNAEPRTIYIDSLAFYKEVLKPLKFEPRPARNLTLFPGQDQGLNGTGPGRLPFPTREETILPTNFVKDFKNEVREIEPGLYEFSYSARDGEIKYRYKPSTGGLGEITCSVNAGKPFVPLHGGGIELEDGSIGKLVSSRLENGAIVVVAFESAEYRLRIWQKSLVIDFICRGGKASGLSLGEVCEIENPRLVLIPYLTFGGSNPRALCFGKADKPAFVSAWVDWYRSNGSALWSQEWVTTDSAKINGGVHYIRKTDGKRNDLYERVFLTASPTFEETLPTIANPPTPHGKTAGERLWQESWGPENYDKEHERSKMLRSYGIEKLIQCNHEITWRDGGESFTLRTKAAPGRGGDEALKKYVAAQKSLGWLSGLYTNYTDYAPVNERWDEDGVQLTPEGEWRAAWPRCYALKPSRAVEWDAKLAPIVHEKFGSTSAYTDVQTAVSPWAYCDFDARVPGAGTFAATFYAYGELLLNDQRIYGPIFSEGTYQWMYAGLASGNYGLAYTGVDLSKEPLNVAFDLMKIHTLECDIGMPWTGGFFKEPGWDKPENIERSIDHFIAATMAYGHIGWLVEEQHGIGRTCRSYYMLQQLQKRYALQPPRSIRYADDKGRWFNVSRAIANEVINDSRLHVRYDNGLQVFVNGSSADWAINGHDGKRIELPSWGWYAWDGKGFLEFSALVDGHRVDYVHGEYDYLDGRGILTRHNGLAAKGGVAVRRSGTEVEIIDCSGNDDIGFQAGPGTLTAYDADGKSLGAVKLRHAQEGMAWFKVKETARKYVFRPRKSRPSDDKVSISFPKDTVVPGEQRPATVDPVQGKITIEGTVTEYVVNSGKVAVAFPTTLKPGDSVWVRLSAESAESWFVLRVVQPFEISLNKTGEAQYQVTVRNNLFGSPKPEIRVGLKAGTGGLRIVQDDGRFTIQPSMEVVEVADMLIVRVWYKDFQSVKEYPVRSVVDHPSVWRALPDEGYSWGYGFRGGSEMPGNTQTGASFYHTKLTSGGVAKDGIFSHPPYQGGVGYVYGITRPIALPNEECAFETFIGIKDGGDVSDGVTFSVLVLDEGKEYPLFEEHWAKREWKQVSADLSDFKGKTIRLKFIADVGPNDNSTADWASWGEPRVVLNEPVMRIEVDR